MQERFGPYEVLGGLARGGSGQVLHARDTRNGEEVALKLFDSDSHESAQARERFRREGTTLSRLQHPHLVPVRDAGEERGVPYLALALVRGETLQDRLKRRGPLPQRLAAQGIRDVSLALHYAHGCGVLHRDVKPSNVLIDERGRFLLADFGLALDQERSDARLSRPGAMMGTPGYWSPEQARGDMHGVDVRSDVWGLGATLFASLTGRPPIVGVTLEEQLAGLLRGAPEFPAEVEVDPALREICLACLQRDPARRPPTADALARALTLWLASEAPPERPARRGRWLLAGGLLLAAGGGLTLARSRPATPSAPTPAAATSATTGLEARLAAAREASQRTAWREAEAAWSDVLAEEPRRVEALAARAQARRALGRRREADADAARALDLDPAHPEALAAWVRSALGGELDAQAEQRLSAALERAPGAPAVRMAEAYLRHARKDLEGALAAADRALEADPTLAEALVLRAVVHIARNRKEEARIDLERATRLAPTQRDGWHFLGYLATADERYPEAIELLTRAIACGPTAMDHYFRAGARVKLGDQEGARADLERAIELDPRNPDFWLLRGDLRLVMGELRGCEEDCTRVLGQLGDEPENRRDREKATRLRAMARGALHRWDGAAEDLAALLEAKPNDAANLVLLGRVRWEGGDPAGALEALERALAQEGDRESALALRAVVLADSGQRDAAASAVKAMGDPPPDSIIFQRGRARILLGDYRGAIDDCSRTIALEEPELLRSYFSREALALALATRALARALLEEDMEAVEADSQRAIQLLGSESCRVPEAWLARGITRLLRGDDEGARADLREALGRMGPRARSGPLAEIAERHLGRLR